LLLVGLHVVGGL
jgi:hypothetical protein